VNYCRKASLEPTSLTSVTRKTLIYCHDWTHYKPGLTFSTTQMKPDRSSTL